MGGLIIDNNFINDFFKGMFLGIIVVMIILIWGWFIDLPFNKRMRRISNKGKREAGLI